MRLILPKSLIRGNEIQDPVIFLAGPIKGGGEWQERACCLIMEQMPEVTIAAPRRWGSDHPLWPYHQEGEEGHFRRQTIWERHYLELASRRGCILFWLPCEDKSNPRSDGQPYARDTLGELGEWRARLAADPTVKVVVGAERDFPGLSVLSCNFNCALGREFTIYPTLEETVSQAIKCCTAK